MADERLVKALLKIGLDANEAKKAISTFKEYQAGLKDTRARAEEATRALRSLSESAMKLREVGTTVALAGGAMLAPFVASAAEYANRYKNLETTSRNFLAAQQASADATARLGRVAATQLTPMLNEVAAVQDRIAAFAEAHPELAKIAISAGAGLVIGGGALAMAGQAVASMAKGAELLSKFAGTGVGEGVLKFGSVLAGATAGLAIYTAIVQEHGKQTGNAAEASFTFADALKQAREIAGTAILGLALAFIEAKRTWGELGDVIGGIWALFKAGVEDFVDMIATAARDLGSRLDEAITNLKNNLIVAMVNLLEKLGMHDQAKAVSKAYDYRTDIDNNGNNQFERDRQQNLKDYGDRATARKNDLAGYGSTLAGNQAARDAQYAKDKASLAPLAASVADFGNTGSLGGGIGAVLTTIKGILGGGATAGGTTATGALPPEAKSAGLDRNKAILASDKQFTADMTALEGKRTDIAKQDAEARAQIDAEQQKGQQDAWTKYVEDDQKAKDEFYATELQNQAKADLAQQQRAREHSDRLLDFAANRDVAGYIQELRNYARQEDAQGKQDDLAKKERQQQFDTTNRERAAQYRSELKTLQTQGDDKRTALDKQTQDQRDALQEQIDARRAKLIEEKTLIDTDFAEKLAGLSGNIAGLSGLQAQYYADQTAALAAYVDANKGKLQELVNGAQGTNYQSGTSASASDYLKSTSSASSSGTGSWHTSGGVVHGSFDKGGTLRQTGLFFGHEGEEVLNPRDAAAYRAGKAAPTVNVTVVTADVASKANIRDASRQILGAVKAGYAV